METPGMITPEQAKTIGKRIAIVAATVGTLILAANYEVEPQRPVGALTLEDIYSD